QVKQLNALVEHLTQYPRVPLNDLAQHFLRKNKLDEQALEEGLRNVETLISLQRVSSGVSLEIGDALECDPGDVEVVCESWGKFEDELAWVKRTLVGELDAVSKNRYYVGMRLEDLEVAGDLSNEEGKDAAEILIERARALTQQFAFHLVTGDLDYCVKQFSSVLREEKTVQDLAKEIANKERTWGKFTTFDQVRVGGVFSDAAGWNSKLDKTVWPANTDKATRRAHTDFQLISALTPGGMPFTAYTMALGVINEDEGLKVRYFKFYRGF
ncbi:MAG: hypothetical protein AAF387_21215, partial [Pseudomonadota bacterium]